jgi:alpha-methylacyl-CoA racemase
MLGMVVFGAALAGFVQGLSGFAFSLVALSVWAWALAPQIAAPLAVFGALVGQIASLASVRGGFDLRRIAPLVLGGVIGVPIGVFALHNVDPVRFKLAVGVFLTLYGLYGLLTSGAARITAGGRGLDAFAGLVGGVMGGLGGVAGSVPAIWTQLRGWTRDLRRATMQVYNIAMHADADDLRAHGNARCRHPSPIRDFCAGDADPFISRRAALRQFQRKDVHAHHSPATACLGRRFGFRFGARALATGISSVERGNEMGPLRGLRIIEMAGLGPAPFAGMLLSDMGANVIRIDRKTKGGGDAFDSVKQANFVDRGRRSIALDLKTPEGVAVALELIANSDAVFEGFRPGVMERLGLGPDVCLARNPKLVFGRITGWGQQGPLAQTAGHDINYIALTGALHAIGKAEAPIAPLNLVGDFGGGAMMLAFGLVCALWQAKTSGKGQVVDAAMTDGVSLLMAMMYGFMAAGRWRDAREANLLDGAAPFYRAYACADGKFVGVGALEPQFYEALIRGLGLEAAALPDRWNPENWPPLRAILEAEFAKRPRDEWAEVFAQTDACVTPVLSMEEAPAHPHNVFRQTFVSGGASPQPAPAPRFSRDAPEIAGPPATGGAESEAILREYGFSEGRIAALRRAGAL